MMRRFQLTARRALIATGVYVLGWQSAVFLLRFAPSFSSLSSSLNQLALGGLFLIGLVWLIWLMEKFWQRRAAGRQANVLDKQVPAVTDPHAAALGRPGRKGVWNPLDPSAWYYGRQNQRLKQSLAAFVSYTLLFFAALFLPQLSGCGKFEYELPAGGGKEVMNMQMVKIQKVIRKKFVINPFSAIIFNPPPIDKVDPQILEVTKSLYQVGQGEGEGAGFSGGTAKGKVRFIRLQYEGGDWNQDFGLGGDLNLLVEYGVRTRQKVAEKTESVTPGELARFVALKCPPLIYMTGQGRIDLSKADRKILRDYLIDKHGMIFGDCGGNSGFHHNFLTLVREITGVQEVPIPLDDVIHRRPYPLPFLPYVAPHGGRIALGWKIDGRWVCYYHPGDIGDAWTDGHSAVKDDVWEACYQLGVNVIYYAHAEYNQWLQAQKK